MLNRKVIAVLYLLGIGPTVGCDAAPTYVNWLEGFDRSAAATAASTNRADYHRILVEAFTTDRVSKRFRESLTERLAKADSEAKQHNRQISEEAISETYNNLVQSMDMPNSLKSNPERVHFIRQTIQTRVPNIITLSDNPRLCQPDEALFLILVLMQSKGELLENQSTNFDASSSSVMKTGRFESLSISDSIFLSRGRSASDLQLKLDEVFDNLGF